MIRLAALDTSWPLIFRSFHILLEQQRMRGKGKGVTYGIKNQPEFRYTFQEVFHPSQSQDMVSTESSKGSVMITSVLLEERQREEVKMFFFFYIYLELKSLTIYKCIHLISAFPHSLWHFAIFILSYFLNFILANKFNFICKFII